MKAAAGDHYGFTWPEESVVFYDDSPSNINYYYAIVNPDVGNLVDAGAIERVYSFSALYCPTD